VDIELGNTEKEKPLSRQETPDVSKKKQRPSLWQRIIMRTTARSESMAYPQTSPFLSRFQYLLRQHSRAVFCTLAFAVFLLIVLSDYFGDIRDQTRNAIRHPLQKLNANNPQWGGAIHPGYFLPQQAVVGKELRFAAVTDLDQLSRIKGDKLQFRSVFSLGNLHRNAQGRYDMAFEEQARTLITNHNEAGRGAEFSELTIYNNRLLTFDDRTGDVFEILNKNGGTDSYCVPRFVITEGTGETDKGMKWEWSTVKDGELYIGSMGKEYTRQDGSIVNRHNLWIAILNNRGELRRIDWTKQYNVVRKALNALSPGYLIIEAVNWSDSLKKWVFLPRRISSEAYDEVKDEKMGGNKVVLVSEDFSEVEVVTIKMESLDPLKGFSSFAFVPGTNDKHALAIRSVEEDCVGGDDSVCKQRSYFLVFDVKTGEVLSDELKYPENLKFEGVEFVNMFAKPPE